MFWGWVPIHIQLNLTLQYYTRFFSLESCCISLSLMAGQWPSAGKDCNGIECFKQMMKAEESQTPTSGNEHVAVALEQVAILETCRRFGEITCVCFVWQSFFPAPTPLNSKAPPVGKRSVILNRYNSQPASIFENLLFMPENDNRTLTPMLELPCCQSEAVGQPFEGE